MKIGVICGSHQPSAQSTRVGQYVAKALEKSSWCKQAWLYALSEEPLPLWQPDVWDDSHQWHRQLRTLSDQLRDSDGLVVVSPEWHGMVPAGLKNFFLLWNKKELAHKPALLVSVSAGMGGAYPIAELRMSSYKNQFLCYIPDHIIVRTVADFLQPVAESEWSEADKKMRKRIAYTLDMLGEYAAALKQVRASKIWDPERYPSGM